MDTKVTDMPLLLTIEPTQMRLALPLEHVAPVFTDIVLAAEDAPLKRVLSAILAGVKHSELIYIYGQSGEGATTILRALCRQISEQNPVSPLFINGVDSANIVPGDIHWYAKCSLICIDNVHCLSESWLDMLSKLISYQQENSLETNLVLVGNRPLSQLGQHFPSSLAVATQFQLHALDDSQRMVVLKRWIAVSGIKMTDEGVRQIILHSRPHAKDLQITWEKVQYRAGKLKSPLYALTGAFVREVLGLE